ncbi:MAG: dihydrolipoyllysine-residue succinyltransferase [Acidobacteria bacterium]|nr:MAG: dihydrolipoyllysine-residue succinyltransferase [Acidobacteriota bacterium]
MSANIVVPEVGESIVDARVAKWLRKEGDTVSAGDPVVELETDKIDLEVGAPKAGVLSRIDRRDGEDVKVGEVLGVIEEAAAGAQPAAVAPPASATPVRGDRSSSASRDAAPPKGPGPRTTPTARKAAQEHDVDLARVRGTGDAGRVMRRDVEQAAQTSGNGGSTQPARPSSARPAPPVAEVRHPDVDAERGEGAPAERVRGIGAPGSSPERGEGVPASSPDRGEGAPGSRLETRERMSKRRATIARRLVEAQRTAAMLTTFNEVDMSAVMALRERHKQAFKEKHGVGLGIASFFVKASIGALREFPRINAELQGDEIVLKHYYDIGVAVGAREGLVVPVLRDADRRSFADIERKIREFAKAAEDGTLSLADLKGGTFTITNGGVFGSLLSTPILNPPQVAILGLHKIQDRPIAVSGQVVVRPMMYVALTYDHRIVDGAEAVRFLVRVKELIEDPGALLLE